MKKQKNIKKGFTLAEILVVLGLLGVLSAILIPVIQNSTPSSEKVIARKSFYTIKNTVTQLLTNTGFYPSDARLADTSTGGGYSGNGKFCNLFKSYLKNIDTTLACPTTHNASTVTKFAKTADGVDWYIINNGFSTSVYNTIIIFDVNSKDSGENCTEYSTPPASYKKKSGNNCKIIDTYAVGIRADGKLSLLSQSTLIKILSTTSNTKE